MPVPLKSLAPETAARLRQDYLDGVKVADILARYEVSNGTLYYWLDGGPIVDEERRLPPIPRRREVLGRRVRRLRGDRESLVARLWRAAERQVQEIEARLGADGRAAPERERDARILAVLVKTLRELAAFDDAQGSGPALPDEDEDDGPRDIDEFRRELVRKMDEVIRARSDGRVPGDAEPAPPRAGDA